MTRDSEKRQPNCRKVSLQKGRAFFFVPQPLKRKSSGILVSQLHTPPRMLPVSKFEVIFSTTQMSTELECSVFPLHHACVMSQGVYNWNENGEPWNSGAAHYIFVQGVGQTGCCSVSGPLKCAEWKSDEEASALLSVSRIRPTTDDRDPHPSPGPEGGSHANENILQKP